MIGCNPYQGGCITTGRKPKLVLSSNITAEDIAGMPEIAMRETVDERLMCLSSHKVDTDVIGGFQVIVTKGVPEGNALFLPHRKTEESLDGLAERSVLIKNSGDE